MKKIEDLRLWLGYFSVLILGILNINSNPGRSFTGIVSYAVVIASTIFICLAYRDKQVKKWINVGLYQAEFFVILLVGIYGGQAFHSWHIAIIVIAIILYLATWVLFFVNRNKNN